MLLNCGVGEDSWVPLTARRSNQSILKEISPEYSLEGLMLKQKLHYFSHLMWRTNSLAKTLMLGKIEDRRRKGRQRMRWLDGITDSMDMSWWRTGRLQSMGLQRVGHDWVTELNWTEDREKQVSYDITYMWNLKRIWYKWTHIQSRNKPRDLENKLTPHTNQMAITKKSTNKC